MSGTEVAGSRLVAAFYPYGSGGVPAPAEPASECLELGAAAIVDRDRGEGLEHYFLSRCGEDWLLHSRAFADAPGLLARAQADRLPVEPPDAAVELLIQLWTLRLPARRRFERMRQCGKLGRVGWQRVAARLRPPPLEDRLRAEGHTVRAIPGPMGTREHLLVFPGRDSHLLLLGRRPPVVDTSPATSRE